MKNISQANIVFGYFKIRKKMNQYYKTQYNIKN